MDQAGDRGLVVVVGDYNLPFLNWDHDDELRCLLPTNTSSEQEFTVVESFIANGLHQLNHYGNANGRILDLVFSTDINVLELVEPPSPLLRVDEHHKPLVLVIETASECEISRATDPLDFDFKRCDFAVLSSMISDVGWVNLLIGCSVDEAVSIFYDKLYGIISEVVPLKQRIDTHRKKQPWWNNELQRLRNRLRRARKRYFRSRNEQHKAELRDLESEYNSLHAQCFRCYIHRTEASLKQDPQQFWQYVKTRKRSNGMPRHLRYQGEAAESPSESANLFSAFFRSVQSNNRPPLTESYLSNLPHYDLNVTVYNFSRQDVFAKLVSIDTSKGAGPDRLSPFFINRCAESIALPVSILFNRSLSEGIFPNKWKTAAITPIHKSGNVNDVENYRAISILSCFPKVLESLVHDSLYRNVQHVISESQHGFVRKRSTTTNLMCYVSSLVDSLEKRQQVDAVYVDFSKAFDKVPHALAVEKLKRMGFPQWLTQWIESYLSERWAFVRLGGTSSETFSITSGVPQGSHLGPLLFVLFVNDLCGLIRSPKYMFADDLKFFRLITSMVDCCALQMDIDSLLEWCSLNGMEVNIRKCNIISFNRSRTTAIFDYKMNASSVNRVSSIKDLGLILDSKLKFTEHIATTTAKAYAILGFIKRNTQQFEDVYCLKTLYCSLVRSILEYGVLVWAPYHVTLCFRIEKIQRNFVRYALRLLPWNDPVVLPPYEDRCALIRLSTLADRRILLQRLFIFDILDNNVDCAELLGKIQFNAPARQTRQNDLLRIPQHRTVYGQNNPLDVCCRRFNESREDYDFNISKTMFKNRISSLTRH